MSVASKYRLPEGPLTLNLHCLHCNKATLVCECKNLVNGQDMYFVLKRVPADMPIRQRLERWSRILVQHPLLSIFDAVEMVKDLPPSFVDDLKEIQPIITNLMETYKKSVFLKKFEKETGIAKHPHGHEQVVKDCDIAIENFFSGDWGHIKLFEYLHLNNAIQGSNPKDFGPDVRAKIQKVFGCIGDILAIYDTFGIKNYDWQLECD